MSVNATLPQLLYIMVCPSAMRAVTHWTLDFLPGLLYSALFLGLAAWYAHRPASCRPPGGRKRSRHARRLSAQHLGDDKNQHGSAQTATH